MRLTMIGFVRIVLTSTFLVSSPYLSEVLAESRAFPVRTSFDHLFVPNGYDDNDNVVVVLAGKMPSTCHKIKDPRTVIDPELRVIDLFPEVLIAGRDCLDIAVPWTVRVHLGRLGEGEYQLRVNGLEVSTLTIAESPAVNRDDFLYPPIDGLSVAGGKILVRGRIPSSCLRLKDVQLMNQGDVIVVLPILEKVGADYDVSSCVPSSRVFSTEVALPEGLTPGDHMLHVREISGQSVNTVFQVK